jgi:helix-turn-helix protein
MGDSVVADFVTNLIPDTGRYEEPVRGRVLMNRAEVVLVTPEDRVRFGVENVFDVAYGSAPEELRAFFEDTVSVAYEASGSKRVALVEGADDTVQRFADLLFKAVLNGTTVAVNHPARIGGRVTDGGFTRGTLQLDDAAVTVRSGDTFTIEASTVSGFERLQREVSGTERPVLSVSHAERGDIVTTEIALSPERKMNVLGRFLRIEYSKLRRELEDVPLEDTEIETLVALYSGATEGSLAGMLGVETTQVQTLLSRLVEKGLLAESDGGWELTPIGTLAVGEHLESVNL